MEKILLFDDGNSIAKSVEELCKKRGFCVEVYRDKVGGFSIEKMIKDPVTIITELERKKYDAIIIAPMYFEYDKENFQTIIDVNLMLPDILMRFADRLLKKNGVILNLISTDYSWGSYCSKYYSAVMAAKVSLTKSYANIWGNQGFRINSVAVGWIESVVEGIMNDNDFSIKVAEGIDRKAKEMTPLGRKGTPEEVAKVFDFLLSNGASYINGQILHVDGGYGNVDSVTKYEYELNLQ